MDRMQFSTLVPKPLSSSDLRIVNDNFQNIYPVFFQSARPESLLLPALWGNHVYHAKTGLRGRCLSIIYSSIRFFFGDAFRAKRLAAVLQQTHRTFKQLEQDLRPHLKAYEKYLRTKCALDHFRDEKRIDLSRREIRRFYSSTSPYLRLFQRAFSKEPRFQSRKKELETKKISARVMQFAQKYLSKMAEEDSGAFFREKQLEKMNSYIHLIRAEGQIQEPLPIKQLKVISIWGKQAEGTDEPDSDLVKLRYWGQKLNRLGDRLDIRNFHKALEVIVQFVKEKFKEKGAHKSNVIRIGQALTRGGFEGFHKIDKKHDGWRRSLCEGDEFTYKEKDKLTKAYLGRPLSGKPEEEDKNLVFEVKDGKNKVDPRYVLKIGMNRADLQIRDKERKAVEYGIRSAEMLYLDPKGRFALMEKLVEPLTNKKWKSKGGEIAKEDKPAADKIKKWIEWNVLQSKTPSNLDIKYLMFNAQKELKTIKGCLPGEFNVMALENLVYAYSNQCLPAYRYMIQPIRSNPNFAQHLEFFECVINNALRSDPRVVSKLGALQVPPITDRGVIERCEQLHGEVAALKKSCLDRIISQYRVTNTSKFQDILRRQIFKFYHTQETFGRLWNTLTPEKLQSAMEEAAKHLLEKK